MAYLAIVFSTFDKKNFDMSGGMLLGFSMMAIAFAIGMILAMFQYKKEHGVIKLNQAYLLCLGIVVIACILYVIVWALVYHFIFPDFKDWYGSCMDAQFKAGKVSKADFDMSAEMMKNYDNPLYFTLYTFMESLPFGLLIAVVLAPIFWFLNRKKK